MRQRTNIRQSQLVTALIAVLALALCSSCRRNKQVATQEETGSSPVVFFDQTISYCVQKSSSPESGDVQVLIDGSGSMVGFDPRLPDIIRWSQHAISAIQNSNLNIRNSRICTFREKEGISGCTAMTGQAPPLKSKGDTNLHEAIRATKDHALTLIVTDGVAATGDQGRGDCATGVDAACVARSFVDSIHSGDTSEDRGLWIVPLVAPYDGLFFTEESIPPASFRSEEAIQKVRSDIALDASIQNPQPGPGGKLVYHYKGPRSLILIVLAKKSEVGRAALQALWERADYLNIKQLGELHNYSGGIAALTPVELYPGFLNKVRWENLKEADDPTALTGTIDAQATNRGGTTTVELNCPNTGENSGSFTLNGTDKPNQVAGCVPIRMMPGFSFDLRPARSEDEAELSQLLNGFKLPSLSYSSIDLNLVCSGNATRRCNQNPFTVQLVAFMRYGVAADSIASSAKPGSTAAVINSLSTAHPSLEPHKITALSLVLKLFYGNIANDARSTVLNTFEICKK